MGQTDPPDTEYWQRLQQVFARAVELSGEERDAYLAKACGADTALREQVVSMLTRAASDEDPFERVIGDAVEGLIANRPEANLAGTVIGAYRLIEPIGYGGMGAVWRARRDDDVYRKDVAIKLMNRGLHNPELRARFSAERQILANLEHPHIARMLDGGDTDSGVPFVIMEYVEGRPLDRYCDDEGLSTKRRLQLFLRICEAVSFAHRNLVVHRDLKPANILVTADGEPKLLDFGIAKLLDTTGMDGPIAETRTAMRMLTPEYASPEQIRGAPITTASDIYSLGVLLYELLTGRPPYPTSGLRPGELERMICEQEPVRPSTAVTRLPGNSRVEAARGRASGRPDSAIDVAQARRAIKLDRDIDNIVLKALRKEPPERYLSVELLADDIRRHLDGLPVSARPATLGYRLSKFVARHRTGVATGVLAVLALVAMTFYHTARLDRERVRAEAEAAVSARVADFMVEMFASADPREARGDDVSARELLDRGAERIRGQLAGDPAIQARLLRTMSRAYYHLSELESALALVDSALEVQDRTGTSAPAERSALLRLRGDILTSLARYEESRESLGQALVEAEAAYGPAHEEIVFINIAIGIVDEFEGDFAAAEAQYLASLEAAAALPGAPDTLARAEGLNLLGRLLRRQGRHEESLAHLRECIRLRDLLLDENDLARATCRGVLGIAYVNLGDFDAAEPLLVQSLALSRRILGDESLGTANDALMLSDVYKFRGQPERALPLAEEALATRRRLLGDDHPDVAMALNNTANILEDLGRVEESIPLQQEALDIYRRTLGDDHPEVATNLNNLASKMRGQGRLEEAEQLYLQTIELDRRVLGESHPFIPMDLANLASVYSAMDRPADAEALLREALALQEANPDVSPVNLASTLTTLGNVMIPREPAEAESLLRRSVEIRETVLAPDSVQLAIGRHLLGRAILKQGRAVEARAIMEPNYVIIEEAYPRGHRSRCFAAERMVELYETLGDKARLAEMQAVVSEEGQC